RRICEIKRIQGKPVFDPEREKEKIKELTKISGAESREYIPRLYETIFEFTKEHEEKKLFGVLGRSLPHTYSPDIHHIIAPEYLYGVIEREPEELDDLFNERKYSGFNVTIPYKTEAAKRCDVLMGDANVINTVNTVVFKDDGKTYGYNTDVYGFEFMLREKRIDPENKNCLVLGHGGASNAVEAALKKMGAAKISFVSRTGDINYENVYEVCEDTDIVINATPVGMYPETDKAPVDLKRFPKVEAVADLIYNPAKTKLMLQAEDMGLKCAGGLSMLVAQAYKAAHIFRGDGKFDEQRALTIIRAVTKILEKNMKNIVFIGMPGCGKTTIAKEVAKKTGREFIDLDEEYLRRYNIKPSEEITKNGEDIFRQKESQLAKDILKESGKVISCGGGIVTREENKDSLKANSVVIYIERPLDVLASEDRPLTQRDGVRKLYEDRKENYENWSDVKVTIDRKEDRSELLTEAVSVLTEEGVL
ncbi:MAG: chorismate mutase, partial [Clostridiales bacterium]|nr:chorismate mutase [Clostridiales bacterium]